MSDETILQRLSDMEKRLHTRIDSVGTAVADNRVQAATGITELKGEVKRVEQKLDDHMDHQSEEHTVNRKKVEELEREVHDVTTTAAVNKTKLGLFLLGSGSAGAGLVELIKRVVGGPSS